MRYLPLWLSLLCACAESTAAPDQGPLDARGSERPPAADLPGTQLATRLRAALEQDGFTVQQGKLRFAQIEDCEGKLTCYGNNPSSPYGILYVPPAPGQTAANPAVEPDGTSAAWRLRPDEAVVFLGPTPPRVKYFSFRSYLYDRDTGLLRKPLFASLGDSLNQLLIGTDGTPQDPFGKLTLVITAADQAIDKRVRAAAQSAGVPAAALNSDAIPASIVRLGLERGADTFGVLLRAAVFADPAQKQSYLASPGGEVLRITPKAAAPAAPLEPFPVPTLRQPGTGSTESGLQGALDQLQAAILAQHAAQKSTVVKVNEAVLDGFQCIAQGTMCNGDNHDTIYPAALPGLLLPGANRFYVVFGVNHEAAGKVSYSNFSIYNLIRALGVAGVDSTKMAGSAKVYLPSHPDADRLYAFKVARDCGSEPYCLAIPTTFPGVPLAGEVMVVFRMYLEPATKTRPLGSELLLDRVIRFDPL